jgi:hypothetical protein
VLNVKYVIAFAPPPAEIATLKDAGLILRLSDGDFRIFQNPTSFPRLYVPKVIWTANNANDSLSIIGTLQPGEAVIEDPSAMSLAGNGVIESFHDNLDTITVKVRADSPALLVFGQNGTPEWHATVNGQAARIRNANYAFQAVEIPQGASEVTFRYTPPGLRVGLYISIAAVLICLSLIFWPARA